jgi:hypothetical protein
MPYTNTETGTLAGSGGLIGGAQGAVLASAASITVTDFIHEVSGSAAISTISGGIANKVYVLIPASGATWTLTAAGNIDEAVTPDGHPVFMVYDGTTFFVLSNGGVANYVRKSGDTMTGPLVGTDFTASGNVAVTGSVSAGGAANAAAILTATSTTKGFLPPRLTTVQRDAIASPLAGLQVYNSTTGVNNFHDGTYWRKFAPKVYDITDKGASGSNTTNDSAAMTACLAAAIADSGGTIYVPPGTWNMGAHTVSGNKISFIGVPGASILAHTGNQKMFTLNSGVTDITFYGIKFSLGAFTGVGSYGVWGNNNTNVTFENCEFNGGAWGAWLQNYTNLKFINCIGTGAGQWPMYAGGGTGLWYVGNRCYSNSTDGIKVGVPTTLRTGTISVTNGNVNVTGVGTLFTTECTIGGYILDGNGVSATITGITNDTAMAVEAWTGSTQAGIQYYADTQVTNRDVFIIGNECYSNTQGGINVDSNSLRNCLISSNVCRDNAGGHGIVVKQVYEGGTFKDIIVSGNILTDNGGGISLQRNDTASATFTYAMVEGNEIRGTDVSAGGIRLQSVDSSVVRGNFVARTAATGIGVQLVDADSNIIENNTILADRAVYIVNQDSTHSCTGNIVQHNSLTFQTAANSYALVQFAVSGTGALADHNGNIIRFNTMTTDVFSTIDTSTTSTSCYENVIGTAASAAPNRYAHIGDVCINGTPSVVDAGANYVNRYVATTTGNPATFKAVRMF